MNTAMLASSLKLRFKSRDSSSANGSAKCPITRRKPTYSQPPWKRRRYHGISSGRLPAQMIKNCEKEKQAHTMTLASSSLPTSCRCFGVRISDIGRKLERNTRIVIRNDKADRPWPAMHSNPNIDEYQCGFSDMAQSIAINVTLNPQKMMPGPLMCRILVSDGSACPSSCRADQRFRYQLRKIQPTKNAAARTMKNVGLRYECFCRRMASACQTSACDQEYRYGIPSAIGMNSSAIRGRVRAAASAGRRITTPHAPPV